MVKGTKSNPVSKRDGVKKELAFKYQLVTKINLTAMPKMGHDALMTGNLSLVAK